MMNRAFGFTNGNWRSTWGADPQWEEGGNENCSLESWQFADEGQGAQRGPPGPPCNLTFRRSSMGNQGSLQAGKGTSGRTATMAFSSTRGPPPGVGFGHITQETSPTQGPTEQGASRLPAATTGNIRMWACKPGHEGTQLTPGPLPMGMHMGTVGQGASRLPAATTGNITMWAFEPSHEETQLTPGPLSMLMHTGTLGAGLPGEVPAPQATARNFGQAAPVGQGEQQQSLAAPKEGHQDIPELGCALRTWDTPSTIMRT
jgi:hypothetical protein